MTWVATAALTLIAALSYGELAAAMPQAGGQYVYLRESFGPLSGFLYGWTLFLVIQTGTDRRRGRSLCQIRWASSCRGSPRRII
jgi:L-asparagine transporter-like permease